MRWTLGLMLWWIDRVGPFSVFPDIHLGDCGFSFNSNLTVPQGLYNCEKTVPTFFNKPLYIVRTSGV